MSENSLAKKLRLQRSCRRCEHWLYPGCVLYSGITKPQIECDTFTLDDDTDDIGTEEELAEMEAEAKTMKKILCSLCGTGHYSPDCKNRPEAERFPPVSDEEGKIRHWLADKCLNGTYPIRQAYRNNYPIGLIPADLWDVDGKFLLGIEYGLKIAVAKIYDGLEDIDLDTELLNT